MNREEYISILETDNASYKKENKKLQSNWNSLREDIEKKIKDIRSNYSQVNGNYFNMNYVIDTYEEVLDKMNELEKRDGE